MVNGAIGVVEGRTVEPRHIQIAEDQIILMLTDQGYRFDPVARRMDHTVALAQDGGKHFSEGLVVIHDQEAPHGNRLPGDLDVSTSRQPTRLREVEPSPPPGFHH